MFFLSKSHECKLQKYSMHCLFLKKKEEKEDIRKKVEYYLDQTKNKSSENLKSLTAAMVYLKALSEKKHFSLKKFLVKKYLFISYIILSF